jgi:hypothetical protein
LRSWAEIVRKPVLVSALLVTSPDREAGGRRNKRAAVSMTGVVVTSRDTAARLPLATGATLTPPDCVEMFANWTKVLDW